MVVYYLNKVSERLTDYRYPIKEGDICMLYDGDVVKTIYLDSEKEADSIWRDFKFIDSKSLKSYHLPKTDSVLCAPVGNRHAIGDTSLLTQLIQECKGEWLLDFLNETSAVLSGFVDYWDLMILRRLTGDDDIGIAYGDKEVLSAFMDQPDDNDEEELEEDFEDDDDIGEDILLENNNIKQFCLSALSCIEDQMDIHSYQILYDMVKGESWNNISSKFLLTTERLRQIIEKAAVQAKKLLIEKHESFEKIKAENAKLKAQLTISREDIAGFKSQLAKEDLTSQETNESRADTEIAELLDTPLKDTKLSKRAVNNLQLLGVNTFADIPQIESYIKISKVKYGTRKTLIEIWDMLKDFHLTYGMSITAVFNVLRTTDWHDAKKKWIGESEKENDIKENNNNISSGNVIGPEVDATIDNHAETEKRMDNTDLRQEKGMVTDDEIGCYIKDLKIEHVYLDSSYKVIKIDESI